jgi:acyl-CoA reductase-like NAD-dependent aldehyde dehydrogenase
VTVPVNSESAQSECQPKISVAGEQIGGDLLEVRSPFDDAIVGVVPTVRPDAVRAAIDAAWRAMKTGLASHERAEILDRAAVIMREKRDYFAHLLALEIGKPVSQGIVEVDRCVQTLLFSAIEARTLAGTGVVFDAHPAGVGRRGFTIRVPIGVIGAITPFNFPLNLAAHKVGPAIAAGCAVVLKPARGAPLAAAEFANVLYEAGLPTDWLSVVVGSSSQIADVLIADDRVGMMTFTGSSEVGWSLVSKAPRKRVSLELGNSTPLIVCADGDLNAAATAAAGSSFGFAGQSCISIQRVIVQTSVHDEFVDLLGKATAEKHVGDPLDPSTDVGPLINEGERDRVVTWIEEATARGAVPIVDIDVDGPLLHPVVLDNVTDGSKVWNKEVFGPYVGVTTFDSFEESIALANGTEYGLQAGIYTRDLNKALTASEELDFGGVTINESPTYRVDQMPYGGTKASGNTREGPHYAVRDMTEERVVVIGG